MGPIGAIIKGRSTWHSLLRKYWLWEAATLSGVEAVMVVEVAEEER